MFINIQLFAHKKGGGSSKNGRDSAAQRLGVKAGDGQCVNAGSIIVRHVGRGNDDTLYALVTGTVKFEVRRNRKQVSVYPVA